jgi:hypothetical protein
MKHSSKKIIATVLIGLQISGFAFADSSQSRLDVSRERALLKSLISLDGQKLSGNDYQAKALQIVGSYEKYAPVDGRSDRLSQAMLDMGVVDQQRAEEMKASISSFVSARIQENPNMNDDERQELALEAAAEQLHHPLTGAEFSDDEKAAFVVGGLGLILIGSIFADVYAGTLTSTTVTSSSSSTGSGSATSTNGSGGSSSSSTVSNSGNSTTTVSSVTPHATEKKLLLTGSYIGYGIVGITAFVFLLGALD